MPEPRRRPRAAQKPPDAYHHADLRRALLDAAIDYLRDGDVTGLTIQALARATGVSPGAPYHHFPDKVSIVAALAEEGFALWLEVAAPAIAREQAPADQLRALATAWLRFAAGHPAHYRVMFLPDVEDRARFASLHATSGRGLALLVEVLDRCLPDVGKPTLLARATVTWASLHGIASLRNAGVLGNIPGLPAVATLEREAVRLLVQAALSPVP